ncbi:MAG: META domain-containing protein [Moraxellaceae bacterium]|nr:META domain-containing protein [Moraxellaceae bacterium]
MFNTKIKMLSIACISLAILPFVSACQTGNTQQIEQKQIMPKPIQVEQKAKPTANKNVLQETLVKYNWQLKSATDKNKKAIKLFSGLKEPVKLKFYQDKQRFGIGLDVGCNRMSTNAKLQGAKLIADSFIMTQMACGDLDKVESTLTKTMQGTSQLAIMPMNFLPNPSMANKEKAMLQQVTADGSTFIWEGKLTNTAKYGKGETVFLEVMGEEKPCSSGINGKCLQVRDVYYDNKGIKTGKSKWRIMSKQIKGYKHNAKTNQIIRLKKYVTDPVDVKGKQIIYVFDMAIETELVQ